MTNKSRSGISSFTKWFGLQVASKAVGLALGAPAITGAVMAGLAYVQGLPLAWGFLAVIVAAAGCSTLLNQARSFLLAYSPANKIQTTGIEIVRATSPAGVKGYGVGIDIYNAADIPLEFRMRKCSAHLEGRIAQSESRLTDGDLVEATSGRTFRIGIVPMEPTISGNLHGELEIELDYGRPGKLSYSLKERHRLSIETKADGQMKSYAMYPLSEIN